MSDIPKSPLPITFVLTRIIPGDPVSVLAGPEANPQLIAELQAKLGLDKSIPEQFLMYIRDVCKGDFDGKPPQPDAEQKDAHDCNPEYRQGGPQQREERTDVVNECILPQSGKKFCRNRAAVAGLSIVALMVFIAVFSPLVARQDPNALDD